jgi:D-xylose transport system ATP-binding protein
VRDLVRQLQKEGIGIFLISHDIHDVFDLSDRISVMKNGRMVGTVKKTEVTTDEVLGMIIGGTKPAHATVTDSYEQTVAAAAASATAAA